MGDEDVRATTTTTEEEEIAGVEGTMMAEEAAEGRRVKETAAGRVETLVTATAATSRDTSGRIAPKDQKKKGPPLRRNRGGPAHKAQPSKIRAPDCFQPADQSYGARRTSI